ncbi:MAG: glycoside hydrolase family 31 protein, partial [Dysgonomonas sp.]|nr:glycoside hydrolase family 31 protein [Dysgonomonas sp.]
IKYFTKTGNLLLKENEQFPRLTEKIEIETVEFDDSKNRTVKTADGDKVISEIASVKKAGTAWKARQQFIWQEGEALYGLGSHQEDYMNLRGTMQYVYQHNLKASVPVLMSTKGYGLLFDAGCAMEFHDDEKGSYMEMLAVNQIDYYFMYGPEFDEIIAQFRQLTGKVPMMPRYIFGYVQSKERYPDQHTIENIVTRFRKEQIPMDVVVQDWSYWNDGWFGHKKFNTKTYPDPTKMIRHIHDNNARFMISIWPHATQNENEEMSAKGFVLGRNIYDAYNPDARKMYWDEYVNKNLFSHGVDAWWCDGTEPIDADWGNHADNIANNAAARFENNVRDQTHLLGALRVNTYSLHHSQGIYENQRATTEQKRVTILTRSTYAGQQRYSTFVWNGDTKATWADFVQQIPSGLNYISTGLPYWTIDAGAFFVADKGSWFWKGDFQKGPEDLGYREFYVRNLQFCQWLPLFRSHGTDFGREPWQFGESGTMFYDAIIKQINLRYRLLPYTYSLASMVSLQDYTMTRSLVFDFRNDSNVYDIKDQLMFGPSIMACPVTKPMYYDAGDKELRGVSKRRLVYLPKGTAWFDFWTGKEYAGGQIITADAPIDKIPVFVKSGSIIPMGPLQQYSSEKLDAEWEIRIYSGKDGKFTVYEDEGDNYNYEQGQYSTFDLIWNDKNRTLRISSRKGSFDGMVKKRDLNIVFVKPGVGTDISEAVGKKITYQGQEMEVKL